MPVTPTPLDELAAWAAIPAAAPELSPLTATPALVVALDGGLDDDTRRRVVAWLRQAPVPVIGLRAATGDAALAAGCDALVDDPDEAAELTERIGAAPLAASIFVRLLRHTENLGIEDALFAESLAYSTLQTGPEYQRWLAQHRAEAPFAHRDDGSAVIVEREDARVALTLNRPSNRNGMTVEMRDALVEALQLVRADPTIGHAILRGAGKCFSTGGDLTEFGSAPDPATAHAVRCLRLPGRELAACADRVEAQLHGACIGSGIEFPAFAGRVTADASTHFQLPELKFGLIPGAGGCVSIPRRIGRQRTAWMVLSGRRIGARQALDWGLIDAIV